MIDFERLKGLRDKAFSEMNLVEGDMVDSFEYMHATDALVTWAKKTCNVMISANDMLTKLETRVEELQSKLTMTTVDLVVTAARGVTDSYIGEMNHIEYLIRNGDRDYVVKHFMKEYTRLTKIEDAVRKFTDDPDGYGFESVEKTLKEERYL